MPTRMIKDKVNYKTKNCIYCNKEIEWWNIWQITIPETIYPLCHDCYRERKDVEKKEVNHE